jgi:hypothetical protein
MNTETRDLSFEETLLVSGGEGKLSPDLGKALKKARDEIKSLITKEELEKAFEGGTTYIPQ